MVYFFLTPSPPPYSHSEFPARLKNPSSPTDTICVGSNDLMYVDISFAQFVRVAGLQEELAPRVPLQRGFFLSAKRRHLRS